MDDAKRRVLIRLKATKKKETDDVAPTGMSISIPSIKRKLQPKGDRPAKRPKCPWSPL